MDKVNINRCKKCGGIIRAEQLDMFDTWYECLHCGEHSTNINHLIDVMTVEQLIEKLSKIKDKSKQVILEPDWGVEVPALGVYENEEMVGISIYTYEEGETPSWTK